LRRSHIVYAALFIALLVGVGLAVYAITPRAAERFTEFYILGPNGMAQDYPTQLEWGQSGTVIIGIVNREGRNARYSIAVKLDNETISTMTEIVLNNSQAWEQTFTFTPPVIGNIQVRMRLDFILYIDGAEVPYRTLRLWITVG